MAARDLDGTVISTTLDNSTYCYDSVQRGTCQVDLTSRIRVLLDQVQILKSHHNSFAPIHRLPPEVIAKIFAFAYQRIRAVARVCSHWRDIALAYPVLWRAIYFSFPPPAVMAMLDRSKESPLEVYIADEDPTPQLLSALSETLKNVHRLRIFNMRYQTHDYIHHASIFSAWKEVRAPVLEELHLENGANYIDRITNYRFIPGDFLAGGAPSLTKLSLIRFGVPWAKAPLGPGLTYLHLEDYYGGNSAERPSVSAFLNSLLGMPLLEEIWLVNYLPESRAHPPAAKTRLHLSNLRRLEIKDSNPNLVQFFCTIRACGLTSLSVKDYGGIDHDEWTLRRTLRYIKAALGEEHRFSTLPGPISLQMGWSNDFVLGYGPSLREAGIGELSLDFGSINVSPPLHLALLNEDFPLRSIESFSMRAWEDHVTSDALWEFVGGMAALKDIAMDGSGFCHLRSLFLSIHEDAQEILREYDLDSDLRPFCFSQGSEGLRTPRHPRFPALARITFSDLDLLNRDADARGARAAAVIEIGRTLQIRESILYPIKGLHLVRHMGNWSDAYVRHLRSQVPDMTFTDENVNLKSESRAP